MSAGDAPATGPASGEAAALVGASRDFVLGRVLPHNARLEEGDRRALRALLAEAGEAGLLGLDEPTDDGGLGLEREVAERAAEPIGTHASLAVSVAAHTTIAYSPVARFGSDEQRATLPARLRGELIGAYALTEPDSGSDALAMRTKTRRVGGDWVIDGRKQFVTNAGICDDLVLFAHADGAGPTAFLVPRDAPGLTVGPEERKLGLHGSSTCSVVLDGVRVPERALLGPAGRGHRVALEALAPARLKVGVLALGHARFLTAVTARYAAERKQFGQAIAGFGLVAQMLGEMVARAFMVESVARRAALEIAGGSLDEVLPLASACKVLGSEMLWRVADLAVQTHGGYGVLRGTWPEQSLRDVRVNRIYEGTNEINRRTTYGSLRKLVVRGALALEREVSGDEDDRERTPARSLAGWLRVALRASLRVACGAGDGAMAGRDELEGAIADLAFMTAAADAAQARARAAAAAYDPHAHLASLAADAGTLLAYQAAMPISLGLRMALGRDMPALPLPTGAAPPFELAAALVALGRAATEAGGDPLAPYELPSLPSPGTG